MAKISNVTPLHSGVTQNPSELANPHGLTFHATKGKRGYFSPEALLADEQRALWPFGELPAEDIARITGVSKATAQRWRRTRRAPRAMRILGHILLHGDLGAVHPSWNGWRLCAGKLSGPGVRQAISTNTLEHFAFSMQRVSALESTIRRLEATIAAMKAQGTGPMTSAQRRERAATLKAIGQAEMFLRMTTAAGRLLDGDEEESPLAAAVAAKTREAGKAAASMVINLYERIDPETGRPYFEYMDAT